MAQYFMFARQSVLALVAIGALAACSVERAEVPNHPPAIKKGVVKFDAEYGVMKLEGSSAITVFFWPEGLDEAQTTNVVRTVKRASLELDAIEVQADGLKKSFGLLTREFLAKQCPASAASTQPSGLGPVDWVTQWKDLPEDASEEQKAARAACLGNQEQRMKLAKDLKGFSAKGEATVGKIFKTLDPAFPAKQENWKTVSAEGSALEITQGEGGHAAVNLTLKNFFRKGVTVTNQAAVLKAVNDANSPDERAFEVTKAVYDSSRKLLVFTVPEVNAQGEPTGAVLNFALERNPNFLGRVRFAGDFTLEKNGVVLRYGSAKLEGVFK